MSKNVVAVVAIAGIVILEAIAIWKGIDGKALAVGLACVAGLGGFTLGKILKGGK